MKMAKYGVFAPCFLHQGDEDGGRKHLCNVGKRLPNYTAQLPSREPFSYCRFENLGSYCRVVVQNPEHAHHFSSFVLLCRAVAIFVLGKVEMAEKHFPSVVAIHRMIDAKLNENVGRSWDNEQQCVVMCMTFIAFCAFFTCLPYRNRDESQDNLRIKRKYEQ
jgi:hypothetical protein